MARTDTTATAKPTVRVASIVKHAAIVVSIAMLYYWLCAINPTLASSGFLPFGTTKVFRVANLLRALVLMHPMTAIGTALGSQIFNISTGKEVLGAYPISASLVAASGVFTWWLSQKVGRSTIKDIACLTIYGVLSGAIVALHLTAVAMLLQGSVWGQLLVTAIWFKILVTVVSVLMGYPLVRILEGVMNRARGSAE